MTRLNDDATIKADRQPVPAPESTPWQLYAMRHAKCQDWRNASDDLLGPYPEQTVEVFRDLGLNDVEIAQYFGVSPRRIKRLSDGSKRSDREGSLRDVAELVRAKLFGGTVS